MNCFLICVSFFFLFNPILNSDVLSFDLKLYKTKQLIYNDQYCYISMNILGSNKSIKISLGSSQFIIDIGQPKLNVTDINIKYDNLYPDKTMFGNITEGVFNIDNYENVTLNVLSNVSSYNSILGLSKGVNYNNSTIEKEYDLNFMSQLIKKGIIDKYYIYLTPFFDIEGNLRNDATLELGRLPIYFDEKYKFSYTPLNNLYPTKWATKLSHIFVGDIKSYNMHDIHADVIFTDSYSDDNYIPERLRTLFRTIFVDKMKCEFSYSYIECPIDKIESTKIYFVFNGYAHLIPSSLLFLSSGNETHRFCSFKFSSEIDYISIDSRIFGAYHRLYDGENNTVRFVYPDDPNFIVDVKDYTGFENRKGVKKEIPSNEYLRDWEQSLKKEEVNINKASIEIENDRKRLRERNKELDKREKEIIDNKEKIETLERENQELNEQIQRDKDLIWHLINYCNGTKH